MTISMKASQPNKILILRLVKEESTPSILRESR